MKEARSNFKSQISGSGSKHQLLPLPAHTIPQ